MHTQTKEKPHLIPLAPPPPSQFVYKKNISLSQQTNEAVVYLCARVTSRERMTTRSRGCCVYVQNGEGGMVDAERKPRIFRFDFPKNLYNR
jgi:hypothetical protein